MRDLNIEILNKNVNTLMLERGITQGVLASAIGMTQPNLSRALSPKNSQYLTLEQTYKIAQFFNVSIDSLVGNSNPVEKASNKEICSFIASLLEKRKLVAFPYTRNEEIFDEESFTSQSPNHADITYNAFIFPNFKDIGPAVHYSDDELECMYQEAVSSGNEDSSNVYINDFLNFYIKMYDIYWNNMITLDEFHDIVARKLKELE